MLEQIPSIITESVIRLRFPWVNPISAEFSDSEQEYFCEPVPWSFNKPQLKMFYVLLAEVEEWYIDRGLPVEVKIYDLREVQGHIFIEAICDYEEVSDIIEKYRTIYMGIN
ncbi:hypothetical protein [Salipaludibacillus sp. CF4.18]|uniref:hypothetical protein n=1 Tax=Salipaludibacillus sp. CF4.18 TaxID=3373081 RepID=UPI003EE5F3AA